MVMAHCTESDFTISPHHEITLILKALSHQTSSHYVLQNGLKLCELPECSINFLYVLGCPEL